MRVAFSRETHTKPAFQNALLFYVKRVAKQSCLDFNSEGMPFSIFFLKETTQKLFMILHEVCHESIGGIAHLCGFWDGPALVRNQERVVFLCMLHKAHPISIPKATQQTRELLQSRALIDNSSHTFFILHHVGLKYVSSPPFSCKLVSMVEEFVEIKAGMWSSQPLTSSAVKGGFGVDSCSHSSLCRSLSKCPRPLILPEFELVRSNVMEQNSQSLIADRPCSSPFWFISL
ncbi:hypothetical protein QOT17_023004 [Balamuthia mandrillaris]